MIDTQAIRDASDIVAVIGSRIQLTKRGREFVGLCFAHADTNPSLWVIPDKNFSHCFSCGWSGDSIAFLQDHDGVDFKTACEMLGGSDWKALPMRSGLGKKPKPRTWIDRRPPHDHQAPDSFSTPALGEPVAIWTYRHEDGAIVGYVARYEVTHDGETRKVTPQWTWGSEPDGEPHWAMKHWTRPRPLYGLDKLTAYPNSQVIVVEGEKTADAAAILFPKSVCITWPGGCQAVQYADWSPLAKRRVIVIPDADEPGRDACRVICATLSAIGCAVQWVNPEPTRSKGWDLADALADHWVNSVAVKWAKDNLRQYQPDAPAASQSTTAPASDVIPPSRKNARPRAKLALVPPDGSTPPPDDPPAPTPPAFSEDSLAAQLVHKHGNDWRYCPRRGHWYRWDGFHWNEEELPTMWDLTRMLCREVVNYEQGALLSEPAKRGLCAAKMHNAIVTIASRDAAITVRDEQWDTDLWALATPAGVVDLTSGELRPARREDYMSQIASVAPAPEPLCPLWRAFLSTVTAGDTALEDYLQRLAGYCLTGLTSEQMFAFFYGTGGNGKGVFLRTLAAIMKDYVKHADITTFTESSTDRHTTEIARLCKSRLVITQETEGSKRLAESKIKMMTGGDKLTARFMRQDDFEFAPKFKIIMAGNHKPGLQDVGEAMRRRVHIVPFTVTIPREQRDLHLEDKLATEHPAILRWMIDGCLAWRRLGLAPPASVLAATEDYMEMEDGLRSWFDECLTLDPSAVSAPGELYASYVTYCEASKEHPWSKKRLMQALYKRDGLSAIREYGVRMVKGVGLRS